ncbi:recombinase family protein [Faecalicoccus pleomorphus]|uniref:recombinase family protein n=1 Tax=Faecalicoccus pleomorphus TaxID=1323 RepID=UPI00142F63DD|nr:recombinase family protein [Faecalicoccus pleomorphus]NJE41267.1 recombinase family protein [Faecalicoccus pleomorphus]
MSKVWGYIRVSAKDQHEDRQVAELLPLVSSRSHLIIEKQSGKNFERPKYQWLKDIMDKGDTLVIKSLDRLGRNYSQIKEEWHELVKQGIYIKVLDSPILDTSEYKNNDLMAQFISNVVLEVLSFVAENERKNIKSRQAEGIAIAKATGKHLGRPRASFPPNWSIVYSQWKQDSITAVQAMKECGLTKTTFYKLVKQYEKSSSN